MSRKISSSSRNGNCYGTAADIVIDNFIFHRDSSMVLVHGVVTGQGELEGLKIGHAWVEDGNNVIDESNGNSIKIPKQLYYKFGRIDERDLVKYTSQEARKMMMKKGNYGPWTKINGLLDG